MIPGTYFRKSDIGCRGAVLFFVGIVVVGALFILLLMLLVRLDQP